MSTINCEDFVSALQYVEKESVFIENVVVKIVSRFSGELDDLVIMVQKNLQMIKEGTMDVYDTDLIELQALKLPTLLYFAGDGLEIIGAETDVAYYRRKELYNEVMESMLETKTKDDRKFTIPDKKAAAEVKTEYEALLEKIYDRSYKQLKLKIEHATRLLESLKKVLEVRIAKINRGKGFDKGE